MGWIGAAIAYRPLAVAVFASGVVLALASPWGLLRHWWVVVSLVATFLLAGVLVLHMPSVSASADRARTAPPADVLALGGDTFHAGVGLALLLAVLALNIAKPRGLTRYGWRRQQR